MSGEVEIDEEFDSPVEAKEFPGLYQNTKDKKEDKKKNKDKMDLDDEELEKSKKKKKDSRKDKGYATLADENSQDEDELQGKNSKGLKGFLSGSKKKDKDKDSSKEKKEKDKEKDKKLKSKDKDKSIREKTPERGGDIPLRIPFSAERHRDIHAHRSSVPTAFFSSLSSSRTSAEVDKDKDKNAGVNPAFLNAPAPLIFQKKKDKDKEKDKKKIKEKKEKDKEHPTPSGVAKVKLKLMRSKNSLEESSFDKGDTQSPPIHRLPEDPEDVKKEILKYEQLLEQMHATINAKSSKKVSKKHEEQLWELQRTLTALKRKLRSINALSMASTSVHQAPVVQAHPQAEGPSQSTTISTNTIEAAIQSQLQPSSSSSPSTNLPRPPSSSIIINKDNEPNNSIPPPPPPQSSSSSSSSTKTVKEGNGNGGKEKENPLLDQQIDDDINKIEAAINITGNKEKEPSSDPKVTKSCEPSSERRSSGQDSTNGSVPLPLIAPPPQKKPSSSARRSLDFSDVENTTEQKEIPEPEPPEPPHVEHSKVEVQVLVHSESKDDDDYEPQEEVEESHPHHHPAPEDIDNYDDSSIGRSEEDDDEDASASEEGSSRNDDNDENIGNVVDDANAMIGSMHEELEAAALVFGQKILRKELFPNHPSSKSEPTFGGGADQHHQMKLIHTLTNNDSSDVELIRDDEEEDEDDDIEDIEERIPEIMNYPEFQTPEYLRYENERLSTFNQIVQDEIIKEEGELEGLEEEWENIRRTKEEQKNNVRKNSDVEQLTITWKALKAENESLNSNVSRLRQMVALSKLQEFKLETRLRYLEDKLVPIISPVTAITPLHSEN